MVITDPNAARRLIDQWRSAPPAAQLRNLRLARETLELDQMYYEQKGNHGGVARCEECLQLLRERVAELQG